MSLAVLTDDQIRGLLENLTADELRDFQLTLASALHDYSNGTQNPETSGQVEQPERISVQSARTGATTLFMPSCSQQGVGVKVITLSPPSDEDGEGRSRDPAGDKPVIRPTGAITLFSETGRPVGILHASTLTAFRTALASTSLLVRRRHVRTVTVFGCGEQAYWHIRLALMLRGATLRHVNIINRRFSPSCKAILKRLSGVPAHLKAREGWADAAVSVLTPGYNEYDRLLREQVQRADVLYCCTPSTRPLFDARLLTSHEARRKGRLVVAVGSYTPAMAELPVELLRQATRRHEKGHRHFHKHAVEGGVVVVDTLDGALKEAGEVIEAGLSPNQLVELGELVMLRRLPPDQDAQESSNASSSTLSLAASEMEQLDLGAAAAAARPSSMAGALAAASEAGTPTTGGSSTAASSRASSPGPDGAAARPPSSHRHPLHHHRRKGSGAAAGRQSPAEGAGFPGYRDDHLARWLQDGNVIYKSVGLGLMDLSVGMAVVRLARDKGVGSHVEGF